MSALGQKRTRVAWGVQEMPMPKPKVPMTVWVMLGMVALFALALSYLLLTGVYTIATW
jgi:hypothetical protein